MPLLNIIWNNPSLSKKIITLDLSYNKLGNNSIDMLNNLIRSDSSDLESLNLEANCLGNKLIGPLLTNISDHLSYKIKYLNIGQNNLEDDISINIVNLLEKCEFLQVLILYWNQIRNRGASLIVNRLKKHQAIRFFDISWNLIGNSLTESDPPKNPGILYQIQQAKFAEPKKNKETKSSISNFAKELSEMFKEKNCGLIHLDISHNNINTYDTELIKEEVKANHTILGIHCDGNEMEIDQLGFINHVDKNKDNISHYANSQIYYRIDENSHLLKTKVINNFSLNIIFILKY